MPPDLRADSDKLKGSVIGDVAFKRLAEGSGE